MHTDLRSVIFVLILRIISTSLAKSLFEDSHLNEFINSRQLREDGFNEFELTSVQEVTSSHQQSLDASSIYRRRRSVDSTESYDIEISAFGESYKMTLQHTKSVLHPSAKVSILTDQVETEWEGDHPDCFLTGNVHSHDGTVSASFCEDLRGMMSTSDHDLHFEVLPHHIRKRGTLSSRQYTTLIARKRREDLLFSDLSQKKDIHQTEYNHERIHKRAVPSSDFTIELAVYVDADYLTYKLTTTNITRRVEIMICKYNAVQCEWSRADVLNYNITLSIKLLTFFDTNPSWYNASTALSVPLNTICTGTEAGLAYDHVHVHTGIPNPKLGGLAYQSQVCNARYRCGVSADGITSYGTVVHEIGHNMGMLHDADRNCLFPDVGIMGGAGVGWSTCSCNDMNTMLQTGNHGCLWTDNIADNEVTPVSLLGLTLVPELPGQLKTADEICEQLYGSGFRYRKYPNVVNPSCNLYSCVDHNVGNTHGQMFKQSNSIPGLYCEDQKICFGDACVDWSVAQMDNPEVRAGGWSDWGTWTTCSRTCGRGMLYRRRICNNPTPKNTASCDGDEYEAQGCSLTPCVGDNAIDSNLIIQRASETCQRLIDNNIINGTEYNASGTIYSSLNHGVCEVFCDSAPEDTILPHTRFGLIENGTPCPGTLDTADANQYSRRPGFYHACLEGYCQRFDCNNTLNAGVFDGCGVCNGDNSTCIIREGNFTDDVPQRGQREWTEIPVGAYNIEMSFVWYDMNQYYTEIYNKEGHPIITSHLNESLILQTGNSPVSFAGTLWHNDYFVAIMHAKGPLTEPVIVKVYSWGSNSNTGMKYIYSVPTDSIETTEAPIEGIETTEAPIEGIETTEAPIEGIETTEAPIEGIETTEAPIEGIETTEAPIEGNASSEKSSCHQELVNAYAGCCTVILILILIIMYLIQIYRKKSGSPSMLKRKRRKRKDQFDLSSPSMLKRKSRKRKDQFDLKNMELSILRVEDETNEKPSRILTKYQTNDEKTEIVTEVTNQKGTTKVPDETNVKEKVSVIDETNHKETGTVTGPKRLSVLAYHRPKGFGIFFIPQNWMLSINTIDSELPRAFKWINDDGGNFVVTKKNCHNLVEHSKQNLPDPNDNGIYQCVRTLEDGTEDKINVVLHVTGLKNKKNNQSSCILMVHPNFWNDDRSQDNAPMDLKKLIASKTEIEKTSKKYEVEWKFRLGRFKKFKTVRQNINQTSLRLTLGPNNRYKDYRCTVTFKSGQKQTYFFHVEVLGEESSNEKKGHPVVGVPNILKEKEDFFYYFAYGSNLLRERLRKNNENAEFVGNAELKGYTLDFISLKESPWKGGLANIIPSKHDSVWGVIWKLNVENIPSLDGQEATYEAIYVKPIFGTNKQVCRTYLIDPTKASKEFKQIPSPQYLHIIALGAQRQGLPSDYLKKLKAIPHNENKEPVPTYSDLIEELGIENITTHSFDSKKNYFNLDTEEEEL